jgi:signal transduction histidine kinase
MAILRNISDKMLHPMLKSNALDYQKATLLLNVSWITAGVTLFFFVFCVIIGFERGIFLTLFELTGFLFVSVLLRRKTSFTLAANYFNGIGVFGALYAVYYSGGLHSTLLFWVVTIVPSLTLLIANRWSVVLWSTIILLSLGFFMYLDVAGLTVESEIGTQWTHVLIPVLSIGLSITLFLITLTYEKEKSKAAVVATHEKNELVQIVEELTKTKNSLAKSHSNLTKKNVMLLAKQKEIIKQTKQLQELNEDKDYIIEVLAHDLKEPLNSISGLIDLISRDENKLSDSQQECVNYIKSTLDKSKRLLKKILQKGELDSNKIKVHLEEADICGIVQNTNDLFLKNAEEKGISIVLEMERCPIPVLTDTVLSAQIFQNILSNSIKFSPSGSTVKISVKQQRTNVHIKFEDQGPGISETEQKLLFGRYAKLSSKPAHGESSSGLGLSLVKRYAELLNSKIRYEGKEGTGAIFIVSMPLNPESK